MAVYDCRTCGAKAGSPYICPAPERVCCHEWTPINLQGTLPIVSLDEAVQKTLMEFDQVLDANPKLEEIVRNNLDQLAGKEFRRKDPDIDVLFKQKPRIAPALKAEPEFPIHPHIARLARGPMMRPDVPALHEFLDTHPDIHKLLEGKPSQTLEGDFLIAHPSLGESFT